MSITIEKARPEDAAEILEAMKVTGRETDNLSFGSEGFPATVQEEQQYLQSLSMSSTSVLFTAKKDGRIVGTASFQAMTMPRTCHRGDFGVSVIKSCWGQGIGSMLLEAIIDFAKNTAHAEIISLNVRSDNSRAISLYKKYGFEKIGRFPGFFKINDCMIDFDLMNLYL